MEKNDETQAEAGVSSDEATSLSSKPIESSKSSADEEEMYEEANEENRDDDEDDESFHDVEPVEFLAQLVTNEATRVLNEEIAGFQAFIEQRRQYIKQHKLC